MRSVIILGSIIISYAINPQFIKIDGVLDLVIIACIIAIAFDLYDVHKIFKELRKEK